MNAKQDFRFVKWQPSQLMEWAKSGGRHLATYDLTCSGVPSVQKLSELPGGPFEPQLWGRNYAGHEGLKGILAEWYGCSANNVLLAQGASECNFLMAGAALAGGGTAIVETPVYEPLLRAVEVWAERLIRLPRRKENGYLPSPDELRRLLTADTRLVVLTNLHNPTHALMDSVLVRELVEVAAACGAVVLVDEVFLPMLQRDHRTHAFAQGAVSVNGLDKAWGLDSLRVGWAIGSAELVHRAYRLNNLLGVNQPYMTEDLAFRILSSSAAVSHLVQRADEALRGRELFDDFLRITEGISCIPPAGGISALVELPVGTDDREFARTLLETQDTAVFPGSFFECPGAIRVSFGGSPAKTKEGLRRLSAHLRRCT